MSKQADFVTIFSNNVTLADREPIREFSYKFNSVTIYIFSDWVDDGDGPAHWLIKAEIFGKNDKEQTLEIEYSKLLWIGMQRWAVDICDVILAMSL